MDRQAQATQAGGQAEQTRSGAAEQTDDAVSIQDDQADRRRIKRQAKQRIQPVRVVRCRG
jgi:hypothetical protein